MSEYVDYGYTSDAYDHVHAYLLPPILKILAQRADRTILDVGCGNGWLVNHLISLGFNAYGTDASITGIEIANRKNKERFFVQNLSQDNLPASLQSHRFNTIISSEVIEHLYSPKHYFNFCHQVLQHAGGGELIVSTPYHGYLKNLALALSGKMDKHFSAGWEGGHIKFWSKQSLSRALAGHGFKVTQFVGCGRMPYLWKSMIMCADL